MKIRCFGLYRRYFDYLHAEALKFARLDYTIEKRKLFTYDNENQIGNPDTGIIIPEIPACRTGREVPNFYATVRIDNQAVLGVVGKDYEVVQRMISMNCV